MSDYARVTIFQTLNGSTLSGETLDDEFDAIQAALNDTNADLADLQSTGRATVLNALDAAYAPVGTESNATRVKNAIIAAAAGGATIRIVYVPKSMWGYVANGDYDSGMYDADVLLVREGGPLFAYDPVAYGADVSGVADSFHPINTCYSHAAAAAGLVAKMVAFTLPGTYKKLTDVDQGAGVVAVMELPGVTHSGAGNFTGTRAWTLDGVYNWSSGLAAARPATGTRAGHGYVATDTNKASVWDGVEWITLNPDADPAISAFSYNADAGAGTRAAVEDPAKIVYVYVSGTTDGAGLLTVDFTEAGFAGAVDLTKHIYSSGTLRYAGGVSDANITNVDAGTNSITIKSDLNSTAIFVALIVVLEP